MDSVDVLGRFSGAKYREQAKSRPGVPESDTSPGKVPPVAYQGSTHKYPDSDMVCHGKVVPCDVLGRVSGSNHSEQAKSRPGVPESDSYLGKSL